MSTRYGAEPSDWIQMDWGYDLTEDLLPVVSNPKAVISPVSSLKALGKTPSLYNARREVVGITKWTKKVATSSEVAGWEKEPDYGICIQTRRLRAIDIDVDDWHFARRIARRFEQELGARLPMRWREDSGRCLLAFRMSGNFPKQSFAVPGGKVEFLGTGQQFVAFGMHPKGARYQWTW